MLNFAQMQSYRPIDPMAKSILATILVGMTIVAFFSIMSSIGRSTRRPESSDWGLWIHRINGYLFIGLGIVIAQYCIRMLVSFGGVTPAPGALHLVTAIPVVLIPIMKAFVARKYRAMGSVLPPLGLTLLLLTWITTALSIAFIFRG